MGTIKHGSKMPYPFCKEERGASWIEDSSKPQPGAWSLCALCGLPAVFVTVDTLRVPTLDEIKAMNASVEFALLCGCLTLARASVQVLEHARRNIGA